MDKFIALPDGSVELARDMAGSRADFKRLLPVATEGKRYVICDNEIAIAVENDRHVIISLGVESMHRIGPAMALPRTLVSFTFHGMSAKEIEGFLAGFDRYYQRGGG